MTEIYVAPPAPVPAPPPAAPPPPAVASPPPAPASSEGSTQSGSAAPYVQPPMAPLMSAPRTSTAAGLTLIPSLLGKPGLGDTKGMSPDVMKALLALFNSKFGDEQIKAGNHGIEMIAKKKEDASELAEKRMQDMFKALEDALKNDGASDALKWVTRILVPALAVLAVPLTLGAAAPVVVFVAVMSAYSLAQFASQEAEGPSLSIADQIGKGIGKLLQDQLHLSEKDAEHYGMIATGVVTVVAAVAMRNAGGVGGLASAAKVAQGGLQIAKVGAMAAAPLMVALDAKFVGNLAGGIAYVGAQELGGQSEEEAANNAAIVNTVFTVATQLAAGVALGRQGSDLGKALKLGAHMTKLANGAGTLQSALTIANGGNTAARGGLHMETTQLQHKADLAEIETERSEVEGEELQSQYELYFGMAQKAQQADQVTTQRLAEIEHEEAQTSRQLVSRMRNEA